MSRHRSVAPSAARLTESLRDIGYDFPSAIADLVDNSVTAGAERVEILIRFNGTDSTVTILDDGEGMNANGLIEALRFGSRRTYGKGDLGRYGLGLKTASLSQCRSLMVVSRRTDEGPVSARELDLDTIIEFDDWLITSPPKARVQPALDVLGHHRGTVVVWRNLDRVLPERRPEGGWAKRRLENLSRKTAEHLAMVFHRFLEGSAGHRLAISVNGEKLKAWDPYAVDEEATRRAGRQTFEVSVGDAVGAVRLESYILPARQDFSSPTRFEELSGPLNWNRQQGLYIYRADRLVQWGGWAGIRGIDEHLKLARASLDFDTELDSLFQINVAKMRVSIPSQLRQLLERPLNDLCIQANQVYRDRTTRILRAERGGVDSDRPTVTPMAGLALKSAAIQAGEYPAFRKVIDHLSVLDQDVWRALGFSDS
ncbi:ATP-binding protein [Geodermatophilus sp. URMC 63]